MLQTLMGALATPGEEMQAMVAELANQVETTQGSWKPKAQTFHNSRPGLPPPMKCCLHKHDPAATGAVLLGEWWRVGLVGSF